MTEPIKAEEYFQGIVNGLRMTIDLFRAMHLVGIRKVTINLDMAEQLLSAFRMELCSPGPNVPHLLPPHTIEALNHCTIFGIELMVLPEEGP